MDKIATTAIAKNFRIITGRSNGSVSFAALMQLPADAFYRPEPLISKECLGNIKVLLRAPLTDLVPELGTDLSRKISPGVIPHENSSTAVRGGAA
jgi:hypothetical protein